MISLAVLADEGVSWRPSSYGYTLGGCRVSLEFPIAKLLDYEAQWETLEQTTNPFGVVVMAHLKTKATHRSPESRLQWKLNLVKGLYERGYSREEVVKLFRFIDWVMVLPEELASRFKAEVRSYEEEKRMRYVTSIERLAKQEGIEQGILLKGRELVIRLLEKRFEAVPSSIVDTISEIDDSSVLQRLFDRAISIGSVAEFQEVLNAIALEEEGEI